jgi:hypothetical protein
MLIGRADFSEERPDHLQMSPYYPEKNLDKSFFTIKPANAQN